MREAFARAVDNLEALLDAQDNRLSNLVGCSVHWTDWKVC